MRKLAVSGLMALLCSIVPGVSSRAGVVINEIHYHPKDKTKPTQFIELLNTEQTEVKIGGWRMEGGVTFQFPEEARIVGGGMLVIAETPEALKAEYGVDAAGPWTERLSHSGAKLTLKDREGKTIDEVEYGSAFPWPTSPDGGGASLELLNAEMNRKAGGAWRSSKSKPTPGKPNSAALKAPIPTVNAVSHVPERPRAGETVRIEARVASAGEVKGATLYVQLVEPGHYIRKTDPEYGTNWTPVAMKRGGGAESGEAIYSAELPGEMQMHRRLVRYRVEVEDAAGEKVLVPYTAEEVGNFAYFVYNGAPAWTGASQPGKTEPITFSASLMKTLPSLTLLAVASDVEHSQWDGGWNKRKIPGTLILNGKVYDHISFHNRGQASTYGAGKNKWGFRSARGQEFAVPDRWGRPYRKNWDSISMNACASPWVQSNRGMAGMDEAVSFRTYELAGVPASQSVPAQFRVISSEEEAGKTQYDGDLWGLYLLLEEPDGAFLDERKLADGNIYRAAGGGDKKHQAAAQPADNRDYDQFLNKVRSRPDEAWWRANFNLEAFYSFRAVSRLVGDVDLRENENHYVYHRADGRWTVMPWDLDMMFIPKSHQSGRVEEDACLELPAFKLEYRNRCRELLDLLCSDASVNGGQFGQMVDELAVPLHPAGHALAWPELDMCRWNYAPRTNDKGMFFRNPTSGAPDHNWERKLVSADFAGFLKFITDFGTPARPVEKPWGRDDGDPRGYGYGYIANDAQDPEAPERPKIELVGAAGNPADRQLFLSSPYEGKNPFASAQFRVGAIAAPGIPGYVAGEPRKYEIEELWTSGELPQEGAEIAIPSGVTLPGHAYRARVRVKDTTGRWSRWSEAVQFVAGAPGKGS